MDRQRWGSNLSSGFRAAAALALVVIGVIVAMIYLSRDGKGPVAEIPTAIPSRIHLPSRQHTALDPRSDGWESEVFVEEAHAQLKALCKLLASSEEIASADLEPIASADVVCHQLVPDVLATVDLHAEIQITRPDDSQEESAARQGRGEFAHVLERFMEGMGTPQERFARMKIIRVAITPTEAQTRVDIEAGGVARGRSVQRFAQWQCSWQRQAGKGPLLTSVRSVQFEESSAPRPWFSDHTRDVLGGNASFHQQVAHGLNYWLQRIERVHLMLYFQRHGLAIADVNGDGWDDVYLCQGGGLPNRLYVQASDGTARDMSAAFGVDWLDQTASALLVDFDNDGDQDLALATVEGVQFLQNDGSGRMTHRLSKRLPDSDLHSLCAADYDLDGDLDLYVCVDHASGGARPGEPRPQFVYHDANEGGANALLENRIGHSGDWEFADVTVAVGLDQNNRRHSLSASWEDFDNDGDADLYVANDYGRNCLYRNDGGRFVDVAEELGVVDFGSGMSVSWGDIDQDGRMDLYVGNMYSSAGNRITRQTQFKEGQPQEIRALYERFAKGNTLYYALPEGGFQEAGGAGVEHGRWAWSSPIVDLNNDGWEDIFVANGFMTTEDTGDL